MFTVLLPRMEEQRSKGPNIISENKKENEKHVLAMVKKRAKRRIKLCIYSHFLLNILK